MHYRVEHKLRLCAFVINPPALWCSAAPGSFPSLFGPDPSLCPLSWAKTTGLLTHVVAGTPQHQLGQRTHSGNWVLKTRLVIEMRDSSQLRWDLFKPITLWLIVTDNVNAACYESSPVRTIYFSSLKGILRDNWSFYACLSFCRRKKHQ